MKNNRADSIAVAFHLSLLERWVAVVTLYPEPSSLGTCTINLQDVLYFLIFTSNRVELSPRSGIFYQCIPMDLNVLKNNEGDLCSPLGCLSQSFGGKV